MDDFQYTQPSIVEVTVDPGVFNGGRVYQNGALQTEFTLSTIFTGSDTDLGSIGGGADETMIHYLAKMLRL